MNDKKITPRIKGYLLFTSLVVLLPNLIYLGLQYRAVYIIQYGEKLMDYSEKMKYLSLYEQLQNYTGYFINSYILFCGIFLIFSGITLVLQKINFKIYLIILWNFFVIQIMGAFIFSFVFNKNGLQTTFNGINILFRQKIITPIFVIPVCVYFILIIIKRLKNRARK